MSARAEWRLGGARTESEPPSVLVLVEVDSQFGAPALTATSATLLECTSELLGLVRQLMP